MTPQPRKLKIKKHEEDEVVVRQHPKHKHYYADQHGNIYRITQLKPNMNRNGYHRVTIKTKRVTDGKRIYGMIARIVYECYHQKTIADNLEINHKDKIRTNNHISNLELVTRQDNLRHRDDQPYNTIEI